ncbi:MAG: AMP-binding protein, partial [Roseiflexaceae bacterium]
MPERNIARYLPHMARERPNQVAVVTGVGRNAHGRVIYDQLTFAELNRESDRYAWGISGYGITRGARVLLMVRAGLPLLSLTFALFKAGCVPILIDPAMGRRNLITCIDECAPDALIGVERAQIARLLFPKAFRTVRHSVTVGRRLFWDGMTLDELHVELSTPFPLAAMRDEHPAAIIFTTGSTGVPKGVAYEHGMFNAQVDTIQALYGITPGEIEMPAFPLFALFNVAMGATSAIPDLDPTRPAACDPAKIVEIMNDQGVTSTFGSPAIWNKVTRYCIERDIRLPQLRRVLMAGAPVPSAIHQRFQSILEPPADTHTPYGATEALPITSISGREALAVQAARADPTAGTCVGRP